MKIVCSLSYVLCNGNDWVAFCSEFGVAEYACNYGQGDQEVTLNKEQAKRYNLL